MMKMHRIYLASPWVCRPQTRVVRTELVGMGCTVTSRWLDAPDGSSVPEDEEHCRREALVDLDDIDLADTIICLTDARPVGAGHHVELGYALARGKQVVVAGPVKSIFHYLAGARFVDWPSARAAMNVVLPGVVLL